MCYKHKGKSKYRPSNHLCIYYQVFFFLTKIITEQGQYSMLVKWQSYAIYRTKSF